jgi:hypothetical protein
MQLSGIFVVVPAVRFSEKSISSRVTWKSVSQVLNINDPFQDLMYAGFDISALPNLLNSVKLKKLYPAYA